MRRSAWMTVIAGIVALAVPLPLAVPVADAAPGAEDVRQQAEAARRAALRDAVAYLTARVPKLPDSDGSPRKPFTQATTGLVLLLDGGGTSGVHRSVLSELRASLSAWLAKVAVESRDENRLPPGPGVADSRCLVQYVWPTGQAALLFAEMDARGVEREEARKGLRTCVQILSEARAANGGWGHGRFRAPKTTDRAPGGLNLLGYPETLLASTNCAAIGLGAAARSLGKEFGLDLEPNRRYYRDARLRNGSFPYDPSQRSSDAAETNAGRTAGAVVAMTALGMPHDDGWKLASAYLGTRRALIAEGHGSPCLNLLHGALAARIAGDAEVRAYADLFVPRVVATHREDGALGCPCEGKAFGVTCDDPSGSLPAVFAEGQREYTTALDALTLLLLDGRPLKSLDRIPAGSAATPGPVTPK